MTDKNLIISTLFMRDFMVKRLEKREENKLQQKANRNLRSIWQRLSQDYLRAQNLQLYSSVKSTSGHL